MPTAFVMQGGGSLAAGQVGMLRALLEAGIRPDLVVGSSAGAINAVGFAQDPTAEGLARLERLWRGMRRGVVFPVRLGDIVAGLAGRRDGVVSPRRLRNLLSANLETTPLEDTAIPVHVVATSVRTGQPVTLSRGDAIRALLASTAIPGIFPPVSIDGELLMDGAVAADVPVLPAEALGATVSYILPAVAPLPPAGGAVRQLVRALSQVLEQAALTHLTAARGKVHILPNPLRHATGPFDFRRTRQLIDEGYALTRKTLA